MNGFRPLTKPKPKANSSWMNGFIVHKSRTDFPIRDDGDHARASGTKNIKSRGGCNG